MQFKVGDKVLLAKPSGFWFGNWNNSKVEYETKVVFNVSEVDEERVRVTVGSAYYTMSVKPNEIIMAEPIIVPKKWKLTGVLNAKAL